MKHMFRALPALADGLAAVSARADVVYYTLEGQNEIKPCRRWTLCWTTCR